MAYISAETTKKIRNALKKAFPNLKLKVSKEHNMKLNVTIVAGDVDLHKVVPHFYQGEEITTRREVFSVNEYWLNGSGYTDEQIAVYTKMIEIIKTEGEWFDKSDIQSDYFHTAFYFGINVGEYGNPYFVK